MKIHAPDSEFVRDWTLLRVLDSAKSIFILALVVRLVTVVAMNVGYRDFIMAADSSIYLRLADSLLSGRGYVLDETGLVASWVPPLFPLVLAILRLTNVDIVLAVGVANAIFGAGTCALLYGICRQSFSDWRVAPAAAALLAVYPYHLFNTGYVLKENLAIALLVLAMFAWLGAMRGGGFKLAALAGLATSLAILARFYPTIGVPAAFLAGLAYERWRHSNLTWQPLAGGLLLGIALGLAPWIAHNWLMTGRPMLSAYGVGSYLYTSNGPGLSPETDGYYEARGLENKDAYFSRADEPNEGGAFAAALSTIASDPIRIARLSAGKAVNMWRPVWEDSQLHTVVVLGGSYVVLMALALLGVLRPGTGRFRFSLWSTVGLYALVHLVFWGMVRERHYLEPFLLAFSGRGMVVLIGAWRPRWLPTGQPSASESPFV